jgi:predicted AAA+ superfamily ATPase
MFETNIAKKILMNDLLTYKGAIFENFVANSLISSGRKLYFYKKHYTYKFSKTSDNLYEKIKKKTDVEIDFVTFQGDNLLLIECKSNNKKPISLINLLKTTEVSTGIKFAVANVGFNNDVLTLPIYMIYLLK